MSQCRYCGEEIMGDGTEEADWAEVCAYCKDQGLDQEEEDDESDPA